MMTTLTELFNNYVNPPEVEELPKLEQKIAEMEKKYTHRTAFGFGMAAAGLTYLFAEVALRGTYPHLTSNTAREIGLYAAVCVEALSMIHGIHSSSILLKIKDVKYNVDTDPK